MSSVDAGLLSTVREIAESSEFELVAIPLKPVSIESPAMRWCGLIQIVMVTLSRCISSSVSARRIFGGPWSQVRSFYHQPKVR